VEERLEHDSGITTQVISDPLKLDLSYAPGQVRIGATWNRYGEAGNSLGEGARGLVGSPSTSAPTLAGQPLTLPPATYYGIVPGVALTTRLKVQAWVQGALCGQAYTQKYSLAGQPRAVFVIDVHVAGPGANARCGVWGGDVKLTFQDGA
jgi:hypothetical protein